MRQGSNSKRPRGKGGNRGGNGGARNALSRSYDSNGPAGRVRGNPHQVLEKYVSLARDAQAEDPILAENLLQHADHYFRLIAEASGKPSRDDNRRDDQSGQDDSRRDDMNGDDGQGDSRSDDRGNRTAAGDGDEQSPQADGSEETGADEAPAPKRARRPRRTKAQQEGAQQEGDAAKSEEVASDAA